MALSASAIAFAAWRWWRPPPTVSVYRRTIGEVDMNWKCEGGHYFTASRQVADRVCSCNQPAYVVANYECPRHGVTEVSVRFAIGADGAPRVSQFRVQQGFWFPATEPVRCPHCGEPMIRKRSDPLEAINRPKKKGG